MSLYRKYRPQDFANLVGQDHIRTTLMNALKNGQVNHAYLFTGPRGTGKTSTARLVAKAINCVALNGAEPCEQCDICKDITDGRLIDLIEIDAASNRGIDEMRDLREKINFAPTRAKNKVYIIDEVHMLTKEAFNALLKTLEEPPSHVYFILATTEVHKIPETILSRCQRFDFKRIANKTLEERLAFIAQAEKIEAELEALEAIARYAQGGLRDAIGLLEQLSVNGKLTYERVRDVLGISGRVSLEKLYDCLVAKDTKAGLEIIGGLYEEGYDLSQFNKDFLEFLRQKMLASVDAGKSAETGWILGLIDCFQDSYEQSRFSTIPQLPLEVAVVQGCLDENSKSQIPSTKLNSNIQISNSNEVAQKKSPIPIETPAVARPAVVAPPVAAPIASSTILNAERTHQSLEKPVAPVAPETQASSVTFEQVQKAWSKILASIKNPVARQTMYASKILNLDGNLLTVVFSTQFHLGKIKENNNLLDVETAIENLLQARLRLMPQLDQGVKKEAQETSELLEVFGGELMD